MLLLVALWTWVALATELSVTVTVYRNGGPVNESDTGVEINVPVRGDLSGLEAHSLSDLSQRLGMDADMCIPLKFYNSKGVALKNTLGLKSTSPLFALPAIPQHHSTAATKMLYEPWIWPGMRVGHKTLLPVRKPDGPDFLTMETLSLRPRLFAIDDFLSAHECEQLIWFGSSFGELEYAATMRHGSDGAEPIVSDGRTNSHGWLSRKYVEMEQHPFGPMMRAIDKRIAALTGMADREVQENLQWVHYANQSEYYVAHHDYLNTAELGNLEGSNRMLTLFFYLNDVDVGGETAFITAGKDGYIPSQVTPDNWGDCNRGIKVKPKRGRAAMWYNLDVSVAGGVMRGVGDPWTWHGGCPPRSGPKWAANRWVWNWAAFGMDHSRD